MATFDGAEDVLVVVLANKHIKQQDLLYPFEVFEDIRKMQRISARKEYVSMRIDQKFVKLPGIAIIDNVLGAENKQLYERFKVELEADRLLFIPLVPTPSW